MPFWTTLSAGSSHHLRFYARTSTSLSLPDLSASLHSSAPYFNFKASGVKPTSADMRMIVNMGGSAFHSTTTSIMRNPVSMLVHGNELSGKPPAGKGDGTGDGSGKSKHHRLRDPSDCVQRQTRIRIEVSDHQRAAQMSITDTSQSDVQGAESGNRRKQRTSPKVSEAVHSGIWWSNSDYFEHLMSDDVSNKEELKNLLGVQSNRPRRHIAQPHESSLGKGLSAELHPWIRFYMGG
ncbi:unnamed protein product [Sphagnum troendelagicum]|uniref:Uncharacterized protein n=1 Tax=Sphagnum troendelagicum TaxID=128251 RepID=A0ABP0V093_9BRYO